MCDPVNAIRIVSKRMMGYTTLNMMLSWTLIFGLFSVTTCSVSVSGDVTLSATPDRVTTGLTKALAVNCSVTLDSDPDMATVMSIIVSKNDNSGANRGYVELAALASSNQVDNKFPSLGAVASGAIHPLNDSYLALEWTYPSDDVSGLYMCQVYGMDADGHPVVKTTITSVSKEDAEVNVVLQRLKELEVKLDERNGCCSKMHQRVQHANAALFEATSDIFNGKRYAMSTLTLTNIAASSFKCRLSGGYLAEIDNEEEFNFVKKFIDQHDAKSKYVALGGTDEHHEGNWTSLESGQPLNFTKWYLTNPDGGKNENCIYLAKQFTSMFDWVCDYPSEQKFLCEIPAVSEAC